MQEVELLATLCERNGFVYLDIPNEILDAFVKMISNRDVKHPKTVSDPKLYVGAHISVISEKETQRIKRNIKEVGDVFPYTIGQLRTTKPKRWDEVDDVFFIVIYSPQLELLRKRYGLSRKLEGRDFHLTVAVKKSL